MTHLRAIGIDLQGGKGNANNFPDVAPTCMAISHGTPNAVMIYAPFRIPPFPRRLSHLNQLNQEAAHAVRYPRQDV